MTKLNLIVLLPAVLLPGVFSLQVQSQVTVGAGSEPVAGALLQLKEKDVSNGGANSTKGLELPRVALTDKSQLYPMFQAGSGGNYLTGSQVYSKAAEDAKHKGLVVYHTGNAALPEGVYYWDGQEWTQAKGTGNVWYVENSSVAATTNSQPIYHQGNVAIGTASANADLTVNGKLAITDAPLMPNSSVLVLDSQGNVGKAVAIPAQMMFVQSKNIQEYSARSNDAARFNQAVPFPVTWMKSDIQSNNIMAFDETVDNSVFTFDQDGVYEISGYLSYKAGAKIPTTAAEMANASSRVGLNVAVQLYLPGGRWQNMAAARHMLSGTLVSISAITIVVPPVLSTFKKGDKIRMVFSRPDVNFGLPHGTDSDFGITDPTGIEFTKGMKVMAY